MLDKVQKKIICMHCYILYKVFQLKKTVWSKDMCKCFKVIHVYTWPWMTQYIYMYLTDNKYVVNITIYNKIIYKC